MTPHLSCFPNGGECEDPLGYFVNNGEPIWRPVPNADSRHMERRSLPIAVVCLLADVGVKTWPTKRVRACRSGAVARHFVSEPMPHW